MLVGRYVRVGSINPHITHPMREDVKQKHFSTLSVRPRSVLASRPLLLRGEDLVWERKQCLRMAGIAFPKHTARKDAATHKGTQVENRRQVNEWYRLSSHVK